MRLPQQPVYGSQPSLALISLQVQVLQVGSWPLVLVSLCCFPERKFVKPILNDSGIRTTSGFSYVLFVNWQLHSMFCMIKPDLHSAHSRNLATLVSGWFSRMLKLGKRSLKKKMKSFSYYMSCCVWNSVYMTESQPGLSAWRRVRISLLQVDCPGQRRIHSWTDLLVHWL